MDVVMCQVEEREVLDIQLEKDERGLGLTVAGYISQRGQYHNTTAAH
jgi:hypothetical protein